MRKATRGMEIRSSINHSYRGGKKQDEAHGKEIK